MKEVKLTKGYVTLVDDEDYERVSAFSWHATVKENGVYAATGRYNEKPSSMYMHRFLLGVTDSKIKVDHKDRNGLNNQRYNLRKATQAENIRNQKLHVDNRSGYRGVNWEAKGWRARIVVNRKSIHLGRFNTAEEAAHAYDKAALQYHGSFAAKNF